MHNAAPDGFLSVHGAGREADSAAHQLQAAPCSQLLSRRGASMGWPGPGAPYVCMCGCHTQTSTSAAYHNTVCWCIWSASFAARKRSLGLCPKPPTTVPPAPETAYSNSRALHHLSLDRHQHTERKGVCWPHAEPPNHTRTTSSASTHQMV